MAKRELVFTWDEFEEISDLQETDRLLLERAGENTKKAYAPYSNFRVGVCALLANGKYIDGANQENASYPMCTCAENTVLAAANISYPREAIIAIAITVDTDEPVPRPVSPCGKCRQQLLESESRQPTDIRIILQGSEGPVYTIGSAKALLPLFFDSSFL